MAINKDASFKNLQTSAALESMQAQIREINGVSLQKIKHWKVKADDR